MKKFNFILFSVFLSLGVNAQTTWSEHIAPIVYAHCAKCHHDGGIAPFSLLTYNQALNNNTAILDAINLGYMPPWPANPEYRHFAFENVVSAEEITAIGDWISGGSVEGDPNLAPPVPVFNDDSVLPEVDFTGQTGDFASTAATHDVYRTFVIPSDFNVDTFLDGIEIIPGNPSIVHHVLIYYDPTDDCLAYDNADPGPGFTTDGTGGGLPPETKTFGVWVPGNSPVILPEGFGFRAEAGGYFLIEIHFPEGSEGETDNTTVNFHFSNDQTPREVYMDPILAHFPPVLQEPFLFIPANDTASFNELYQVNFNVSLLNVFPHMHLIGRTLRSWAETPNNQVIPLVDIDDWDFHWQYTYTYPSFVHIPAGTDIRARAFYDNTVNNPHQPNDPPQNVFGGESTSDEMMVVFFTYTGYQAGDENIVIDPSLSQNEIASDSRKFAIYPNPANDILYLNSFVNNRETLNCSIYDSYGRLVDSKTIKISSGIDKNELDTSKLTSGLYHLSIENGGKLTSFTFIKE